MKKKKTKASKKIKDDNLPFAENLRAFTNHIEGLNKSLIGVELLQGILNAENKKLENFIQNKAKNVKKNGDFISYALPPEHIQAHDEMRRERDNSQAAYKILPRSLFVGMVSQFDVFIGSLIKIVLDIQPNIISPEKTLSFKDIKNFTTIKEAVSHLIEKEIDTLLFDSHTAHLEWIGSRTGINIKKNFSTELPTFVELTERRNLFVHSDGVVNEQYLFKCKEAGVNLDSKIKKGERLQINPTYFKQSLECLYKIALKLTYLLWRKLIAKQLEKADTSFNNDVVADLICQKKYLAAEELFTFAQNEFIDSTDGLKKVFAINLALVKKLGGRKDEALALISNTDWTACNDDLKLAVAAIKDDYTEVFKLMKKIGKEGDIMHENGYRSDPIFASVRAQKEFPKVFEEIYNKKFEITEYDKKLKVSFKRKKQKS